MDIKDFIDKLSKFYANRNDIRSQNGKYFVTNYLFRKFIFVLLFDGMQPSNQKELSIF